MYFPFPVPNSLIPSPFALNLIAQGYMDVMKTEERREFIKRMHQAVLMKIKEKELLRPRLPAF
jgi:ATP-dependent Lhr-like helicase